nr:PAS domain S-box protein [uncultured Desulfobacter sp.]
MLKSFFKKIKGAVDSVAKNQNVNPDEELSSAFNAMTSAVWIIDKDHSILKSNTAAERLFHRSNSEVIGEKCWRILHGTNQPIKECPLIKARQSLQQECIEMPINGRWFEVVVNPILDSSGKPSKYIHIVTDITEAKLTKAELVVQSERIQTFFNSINDAIFVHPLALDGFKPFVEVNDIACKRYGYTYDELMHLSASDITVKPDVIGHSSPHCRNNLLKNKLLVFETCHVKKSGEIFPVEINSNIFYQNGKPHILAVVRDITDRKKAEEVLRKSEQAFRNLFDNHAAVKLILDPGTGRIIAANKAAEEFYGWRCDTLTQMNIDQINTKSFDEIKPLMAKAKKQERICFEFQHRLADGSLRDVEVFSSGVEMNGEKYLHSIVHDITEQKKVTKDMEELRIQNWHLKKQESLSRMAGAISHHFNNHLMAIMGNLELSLKLIERGDSPLKHLMKSMDVAQNAAKVNGLMLTYLGKNTSGKMPMDIGKVCRMTMPLLRASLPINIVVEADFPDQGPIIHGNENQIQQLVTNLVTNAAESYQKEGTIFFSLKTVSSDQIPKKHRFPVDWVPDHENYACIEVADTGCGIEKQNIEKIFDPFFSTKTTGRGLDLPVVLGIAQNNNGVITLESEPGKGSTFRFFAPVEAQPNSP